jgi:hypothetical protein
MLFSLLYMVLRVIFRSPLQGTSAIMKSRSSSFAIRSRFSSAKLAAPSSHVVPGMQADAAAAVDALLAKNSVGQGAS